MQCLAGPEKVRYLAENAGSMEDMHFDAFCRLLKLEPAKRKSFLWDVTTFGAPIQRGRNFFRGHNDSEEICLSACYFPEGWGPLIDQAGNVVPLSPLLRTRTVEAFGVYRSSWTLYQPKALVWNYEYWGGQDRFCREIRYTGGRIPECKWTKYIPPPFQETWKLFIDCLSKTKASVEKLDKYVQQLVPLFACSTFELPFRIVSPSEALKLSGLEGHWVHNSLHDAQFLPDNIIRDMCGNSFHAPLVCGALGRTSTLLSWISGEHGPERGERSTLVASKQEAHAIYADLVSQVTKRAVQEYPNKQIPIQRTLPDLPDLMHTPKVDPPKIETCGLATNRGVKVTKEQRLAQYREEAAARLLTQAEISALQRAELAWVFESLRAAVHVPFDFHNILRILWGSSNPQQAASTHCDFPDFQRLQKLQNAFQSMEVVSPSLLLCLDVLLLLVELKEHSQWPLDSRHCLCQ